MEPNHLTESEIQEYLGRGPDPAGILRVHDHLADCPACRSALSARRTEFRPASHAGEDDLILFVDDRLSPRDRSRVENHLAECPDCRDTVEDLRVFKGELAGAVPMRAQARRRSVPVWAVASAAALVLVAGVVATRLAQRPDRPAYVASVEDASGVIGVDDRGRIGGVMVSPGDEEALRLALRYGRLPAGPAALAGGGPGVLRSGSGEAAQYRLIYPTHDRVLADVPEFRWARLEGATSYEVKVFDEGFNEVAASGPLTATGWRPGTGLTRGKTYLWQVTAMRRGEPIIQPAPPQPEARFQVLSQDASDRIGRARAATPVSHLLLAVTYAREGLRTEALAEIDELGRLNPGSSLVDRLKKDLDGEAIR